MTLSFLGGKALGVSDLPGPRSPLLGRHPGGTEVGEKVSGGVPSSGQSRPAGRSPRPGPSFPPHSVH